MPTAPPPGIYVPAVIFFDDVEKLDFHSIKAHVLRLAEAGVTGILVQGSNGEAQHLSHQERKDVISFTRETLDRNDHKEVLVIAGTGAQTAWETIQLCKDAHEAGASHALVLTPSVWPKMMTPDNIYHFHTDVAKASPIPTMIYNFPTVTAGQDLDSDIIGKLADHPNIVGTKLSCGNIGKLHRLTSRPRSQAGDPLYQFAVFAGRSDTFLFGLNGGSAGAIAAQANLFPRLHVRLYQLWKDKKFDDAMALQEKLSHGDWATSKIGGIGGIKAIIARHFGYGNPNVRRPLQAVTLPSLMPPTYSMPVSGNESYEYILDLIKIENAA